MTSTEQGTFNDRNSSRVLRPPGGGSSNIFAFGTDDSDDRNRKSTNDNKRSANTTAPASDPLSPQVNSNVVNSDEKQPVTEGDKANQENNCDSSKPTSVATGSERPTPEIPSVDRATLANRGRAGGSNFNILTGEPLKTEQQSSTAAAGVRVRQPPGGASTKLW